MIIYRKVRTVLAKQLRFPDGWQTIKESQLARELAESFKATGIINMPTVRGSDLKLICGAHRVAALIANAKVKNPLVRVQIVECSDAEVEMMRLEENLKRADLPDRDRAIKRLVELRRHVRATETLPKDKKPPRILAAKSEERRARTETAKALGITPDAVRAAVKRAEPQKASGVPVKVELFGCTDVPEYIVTRTNEVLFAVARASALCSRAVAAMNLVVNDMPEKSWKAIAEPLARLGHTIRGLRPVALCPYCKAVPALMRRCVACDGKGWAHDDMMPDVPTELRRADPCMVVKDGEFVRRDELMADPAVTKQKE